MTGKIQIHWFRRDLRIENNQALTFACSRGPTLCIFNWGSPENKNLGPVNKWWLKKSLESLSDNLKSIGLTLYVFNDSSESIFNQIEKYYNIDSICWNSVYPHHQEEENLQESLFKNFPEKLKCFSGNHLIEPGQLLKADGTPYKVYTAYWNAFNKQHELLIQRQKIKYAEGIVLDKKIPYCKIKDLPLVSKLSWYDKIETNWTPGEPEAAKITNSFIKNRLNSYLTQRDIPSSQGTSNLSPYLIFGEVCIKDIWQKVITYQKNKQSSLQDIIQFKKELIWRDFAYDILQHNPNATKQPLNKKFSGFPYIQNDELYNLWKSGRTGYPIVDAGMRQLWQTGWMHNRVRMIVASFLTKHLLIPWQMGYEWFAYTLADGDIANNSQGWQWVAGCGYDAAPYYRIFNPITQSKKFDKEGIYIKKWVPELKNIPSKYIHQPWETPEMIQKQLEITIGKDYPSPIVDHGKARVKALEAYQMLNTDSLALV